MVLNEKFKANGITVPHIVTWIAQLIIFLLLIYGFFFSVKTHMDDKISHLTFKDRIEMRKKLDKINAELDKRDLKVEKIIRETVQQLKEEGVIK